MGSNLERGSLLHKRYRIVDILGQGGMGSVYRAIDENLGMDVAVKENLFTTDEYARQFRLEAVILANLRHTNLPRVTDHFVIPDQGQYLIMDYIDGEDLRQRMEREGPIPEDDAVRVGTAMCDALEYLHTRKPIIIHRDLKPGNVRITPEGHIFLVDFGLAKLVRGSQATTTGARAMTPGYSPPEQYGASRTNPLTDIYSLGATLYAVLSACIPEDGLARAMDNVELPSLVKRNPKVSRKLASVIEKAMAIRPEDRFQSAQEFRQALLGSGKITRLAAGNGSENPPPEDQRTADLDNSGSPAVKNWKRWLAAFFPKNPGNIPFWKIPRWQIISILAVMILAVVSFLIFWSPLGKASLPPQPTASPSLFSPSLPATLTIPINVILSSPTSSASTVTIFPSVSATWTLLPTYLPSITPTPTVTYGPTPTSIGGGAGQIAFASDRNGTPQIFIMDAAGNNLRQLTNMTLGACQPAWSPDGKRLVVVSPCPARQEQYPAAKLYFIDPETSGQPIEIPSVPGGDFDPAWSPDGKSIAFTSLRAGSRQIYLLNLSDNMVEPLTQPSNDQKTPDWSSTPAWSPDGAHIIFTALSRLTNTPQIWIMSGTGQDQHVLIARGVELWNFHPAWSPDGLIVLFNETSGPQELGWEMLFDIKTGNAVHLRGSTFGSNGNYSPDGQWITYETKDSEDLERPDYDIYRIKADGTGAILRLTNTHFYEFDPVWRPDLTLYH